MTIAVVQLKHCPVAVLLDPSCSRQCNAEVVPSSKRKCTELHLVQQEDARIAQESASDGHALLLPARHLNPLLPDVCLIPAQKILSSHNPQLHLDVGTSMHRQDKRSS